MVSGQIFKLSVPSGKCYVGMSSIPINYRLNNMKADYKKYLKGEITDSEVLPLMGEPYSVTILERITAETRGPIDARHRYWIENTPNCVNKRIPGRTYTQYYQDKREEIRKKQKERYQKNKEVILQKVKDYQAKKKEASAQGVEDITTKLSAFIPEVKPPETKKPVAEVISKWFSIDFP